MHFTWRRNKSITYIMDSILDVTDSGIVEDIRKKKIEFFKSGLNLYKGIRLSLEAINESIQSNIDVPDHLRTYEVLHKGYKSIQNEVTLLQCFVDITRVIHNTIAMANLSLLENEEQRKEIQNTLNGITHFTKEILNLYEQNCNELQEIEISKHYDSILEKYRNYLETQNSLPRAMNSNISEENKSKVEKLEHKIEKINVIRAMKAILLAKYANSFDQYPNLQLLRTSNRRNLTKDDFIETWDVGLKEE